MPWIRSIDPKNATGKLHDLYDRIKSPDGQVDHIMEVHSLRPNTLVGHLSIYKAVMHSRPNSLEKRERELIAAVVSTLNNCDYCAQHHTAALARIVGSMEEARALVSEAAEEKDSGRMTAREKALIIYTKKLTLSPGVMEAEDVDALRNAGFDDGAILDANQIVSYFAYANRTVQGLGVTVEGEALGLHPDENEEGFRHR